MRRANGYVLWEGASLWDGAPIAVVATCFVRPSENDKTDDMIQVFILPRDVAPIESLKTGADASVCGDCRHRGDGTGRLRSCYVDIGKSPTVVWHAYQRGIYPKCETLADVAAVGATATKSIRLGAWGDPGMVPREVWDSLLSMTTQTHTGYTHRWADVGASLKGVCMASVDSVTEKWDANARGFASFRVVRPDEKRERGEAQCPASEEAGHRVKCKGCPIQCDGATSEALQGRAIVVHGAGQVHFN